MTATNVELSFHLLDVKCLDMVMNYTALVLDNFHVFAKDLLEIGPRICVSKGVPYFNRQPLESSGIGPCS